MQSPKLQWDFSWPCKLPQPAAHIQDAGEDLSLTLRSCLSLSQEYVFILVLSCGHPVPVPKSCSRQSPLAASSAPPSLASPHTSQKLLSKSCWCLFLPFLMHSRPPTFLPWALQVSLHALSLDNFTLDMTLMAYNSVSIQPLFPWPCHDLDTEHWGIHSSVFWVFLLEHPQSTTTSKWLKYNTLCSLDFFFWNLLVTFHPFTLSRCSSQNQSQVQLSPILVLLFHWLPS